MWSDVVISHTSQYHRLVVRYDMIQYIYVHSEADVMASIMYRTA